MISSLVLLSRAPVGSSARIKRWLIYQRPSDGNALLLATGELIWPMVSAMAQADALQSLCGSALPLNSVKPRIDERKLDIFQCG